MCSELAKYYAARLFPSLRRRDQSSVDAVIATRYGEEIARTTNKLDLTLDSLGLEIPEILRKPPNSSSDSNQDDAVEPLFAIYYLQASLPPRTGEQRPTNGIIADAVSLLLDQLVRIKAASDELWVWLNRIRRAEAPRTNSNLQTKEWLPETTGIRILYFPIRVALLSTKWMYNHVADGAGRVEKDVDKRIDWTVANVVTKKRLSPRVRQLNELISGCGYDTRLKYLADHPYFPDLAAQVHQAEGALGTYQAGDSERTVDFLLHLEAILGKICFILHRIQTTPSDSVTVKMYEQAQDISERTTAEHLTEIMQDLLTRTTLYKAQLTLIKKRAHDFPVWLVADFLRILNPAMQNKLETIFHDPVLWRYLQRLHNISLALDNGLDATTIKPPTQPQFTTTAPPPNAAPSP